MATRTTTKHHIPHPEEPGTSIVGVLEQVSPGEPTEGRPIALILHGAMGHKDYLFQKRLALRLPMDSFRFDFRGNHETGGEFKQGSLMEDVQDLVAVVAYLKRTFGYIPDLIVGHSRGSVVAQYWICKTEDGRRVRGMVNASGRYRMNHIYDRMSVWAPEIETNGFYTWRTTVARKSVVGRIYPEGLADFAAWDTSFLWTEYPSQVDVLTVHGVRDDVVPVYDAVIHARALGNRSPGTHTLHLVEEADHNFTGRQDEIVDTILEWWALHQEGQLTSGLWKQGVQGKL
ncbi:ectomycorrhiza-regulated esterase [Athelia psychrophila]|uniref:Ectomycorrhiza-regulated esterase n=1 Tax=Athelia psychrophila TaxID=1759441 RepID=A0A166Q0Z6_9AGAM|nr:ectomycorrhiza-regulated esterase [Fibularhizoctonia sp. CBS 109695]